MTTLARNQLHLPGPDGSNLLAFLASLGTWRIALETYPGIRMNWIAHAGKWTPVLHFEKEVPDNFIQSVDQNLRKMQGQEVFTFSDNLKLAVQEFRKKAEEAVIGFHEKNDQISVAFLSAFASETAVNNQGNVQDTSFRTMSGAGHQHFLKTMRDLTERTTLDQIQRTLFHTWSYSEEKIGLRWDPSEDKRYALAWKNPSQDTTMTERGANRLAIEALPLFPTAAMGKNLETTGFTGHRSNDTFLRWPIWKDPIDLDTVRSLLALRELVEEKTTKLLLRGIVAVFRSQRITVGKFRNFTPATRIF